MGAFLFQKCVIFSLKLSMKEMGREDKKEGGRKRRRERWREREKNGFG